MAPEMIGGEPVSAATDLYALGAMLFELVTGRPPYDGNSPLQVLERHVRSDVPSAAERRGDVPGKLDELIRSLLAKDPGCRPPSARDVVRRLERCRGDAAGPGRASPSPGRPHRARWRSLRAGAWLAGAGVVSLVAFAAIRWLASPGPGVEAARLRGQLERALAGGSPPDLDAARRYLELAPWTRPPDTTTARLRELVSTAWIAEVHSLSKMVDRLLADWAALPGTGPCRDRWELDAVQRVIARLEGDESRQIRNRARDLAAKNVAESDDGEVEDHVARRDAGAPAADCGQRTALDAQRAYVGAHLPDALRHRLSLRTSEAPLVLGLAGHGGLPASLEARLGLAVRDLDRAAAVSGIDRTPGRPPAP
jgi:hypothetical protein